MKQWLKQLDISKGLQLCFILSALLSLFVGAIGFYTLDRQRVEISLAIDEDFPKVQAAFQAEEQANLLHNAFTQLSNAKNFIDKVHWRTLTEIRLNALKEILIELENDVDDDLFESLNQLYTLLEILSERVEASLEYAELLNQTLSKINWLHDDFHNEFTALLQEVSWQQSALMNTIQNNNKNNLQFNSLKKIQQELQQVYHLVSYEDQIVSELKLQIMSNQSYINNRQGNYLSYMKLLVDQKLKKLEIHSSIYTIKQIIDELLDIGLNDKQLPALLNKQKDITLQLAELTNQKDQLLLDIRDRIREQVGSSQKQLGMLQGIVDKSTKISGMIIVITMLIAFLFVIAVNYFYIRLRLLKRFLILNKAVDALNQGMLDIKIPVYGVDELGRIAKLLRSFLYEMKTKNSELAQRNKILINEINERVYIENKLRTTQNELIQTAKLAVVGKTLTSISHEINQPLNALSTYIFSAKKTMTQQDSHAVLCYLDKMSYLVERTALIVKRLRQFSRKGTGCLLPVNLSRCIDEAWNLLEPKHKPQQGEINRPQHIPHAMGEEVLFQQVFVNLFLNSLEASHNQKPIINIVIVDVDNQFFQLFISDNATGWPLHEKLLEPFSSSKSINLGLGLSISDSIVKQCDGQLHIASTLNHNALIILTLRKVPHV